MILFVASNPSRFNLDPHIPMIGSRSAKNFNAWVEYLVPSGEFVVINASDKVLKKGEVLTVEDIDFETLTEWTQNKDVVKVIALGNVAAKSLSYIGVKYYKLPHPSPRNRLLNKTKQVEAVLEDCKVWLEA